MPNFEHQLKKDLLLSTKDYLSNTPFQEKHITSNSDSLADSGVYNQSLVSSLIHEKPYCLLICFH